MNHNYLPLIHPKPVSESIFIQGSRRKSLCTRIATGYSEIVRTRLRCLLGFALVASTWAQDTDTRLPRFEDYPVPEAWLSKPARVKLTTRSERMFRTRLTNATKEPPNFAGHYRFTVWGCGSNCSSGALVDLDTGNVFSPPLATGTGWMHFSLCQSAFENSGVEHYVTSRLLILRCGLNYSERLQQNIPDTY